MRLVKEQSDSPVNSDPDVARDRGFVSVIYGNELEAQEMFSRRHQRHSGNQLVIFVLFQNNNRH
jgi:hypothetical protein